MNLQGQEEQLRREVAGLAEDDILALCYAFKGKAPRLRLYLDVLRGRGNQRAQFASCLICFDLARQGDLSLQREFIFLADTIRALAADGELVVALIGQDPYLGFIWDLLQAALAEMDPLENEPLVNAAQSVGVVAELPLLVDDDLRDFGVSTDDETLWRRFDDAVENFLGGVVGVPVYDPHAGFRLNNKRDVERIEAFLQKLNSLRDLIPPARGFRALTLLFYGTQMRSRSLFGAVNARKQELLRDGLDEFAKSGPAVWEVAGVFSSMHAAPSAWEKIADVLADYTHWLMFSRSEAALGIQHYDAVGRMSRRGKA